jgi:hypothetical protein
MRYARNLLPGVYLLGLAVGSLGLIGGCGGNRETGTQVQVDAAKEEAQRKQMQQFYGPSPGEKKAKTR